MHFHSSKLIRHGTRRVFFRFVCSKGCAIRKRGNKGEERNGRDQKCRLVDAT